MRNLYLAWIQKIPTFQILNSLYYTAFYNNFINRGLKFIPLAVAGAALEFLDSSDSGGGTGNFD